MRDEPMRAEAYAALTGSPFPPARELQIYNVTGPDDLVKVFKKLLSLPTGKTARVTIEELRS